MAEQPNRAGGSAQRRYDRTRARERAQKRENFPRSLAIIGALTAGAFLLALFVISFANSAWDSLTASSTGSPGSASTPLISGGLALLLAGAFSFRTAVTLGRRAWGRRRSTEAWAIGARGERATGNLLTSLEHEGWVVLHDRRKPGSRGNLDHVLIGPPGIVVVETKNFNGQVTIRHGRLWHNRRRCDDVVHQVQGQMAAVAAAIPGWPVNAVICIHRAAVRTPPFWSRPQVAGIPVVPARRLVGYLRRSPARLNPAAVHQLAEYVRQVLPPTLVDDDVAETADAATAWPSSPPTAAAAHWPCRCGGHFVVRHRRRDASTFLGCSRFPACRATRPLPTPGAPAAGL